LDRVNSQRISPEGTFGCAVYGSDVWGRRD